MSQGQNFCKTTFGSKWVTISPHPLSERNFFDYDSIVFTRKSAAFEKITYRYLSIHCSDSTFELWGVHTVNQVAGDSVRIASTSSSYEGIYQLDTIQKVISFKLNESGKTYTFLIVPVYDKEAIPRIVYTSDGDYRTGILLLRK